MSSEKLKVLYLAGVGRSGSTLLGRLLGQPVEGIHIGELVYIWKRSFREQHVCGCGAPFLECLFWTEVFQRGFGGFDGVDYEDLLQTKCQLERTRTLPRLLSPWKTVEMKRRLEEYQQVLSTLYRAIADTSGAHLVIDSSKSEAYGYLLESVPGLDVRAVHLVRESRAVAHSLQRRKPDPSQYAVPATLATTSPVRAALLWNATNLLLTLKMPGSAHRLLRYEDFVLDPEATLRRLWTLMDDPVPDLNFLSGTSMRLRTNHTVAGNPDRFQADITIQPDIEWRRKLPASDQRIVSALTFPLLFRYGYWKPWSSLEALKPIQVRDVL